MANKKSRSAAREQRHIRVRARITGTTERPRLSIFRSLTGIYAQIIDDTAGCTLASASTIDNGIKAELAGLKREEQARRIGKALAERAKAKGIQTVVFDRGGYRYTGRVKALADGAREAGLEF
jgi:large subunit ribosomal protein L18